MAPLPKVDYIKTTGPLFTPPLRTSGRYILDANHARVKLCSINWYGASDINFIPSGLDVQNRSHIAARIRSMGFNSVRLPFSGQMARDDPLIPDAHISANPDLFGSSAIQVFVAVVHALTDAGLGVVINDHVTRASWCDGVNPCDWWWANDWLGPFCSVRQTELEWIERWERVMHPLKDNPLVVGVDLRNEPRGLWGTMWWEKWALAAEKAGRRLLEKNSDWLIIVEGVGSANDLSGVKTRPVNVGMGGRVVYSAHVFAWSGWGQRKKYSVATYEQFSKAMRHNWAYLLEGDVAPVWIAELGAGTGGNDPGERNYWSNLMRFLSDVDADWGYWQLNPRKVQGNEVETWRLIEDDWDTVVEDFRLDGLKAIMGKRPMNKSDIV
jgi:endoglucanase